MSEGKSETTEDTAVQQLLELTKHWNSFEDVPRSQQIECRQIGERINAYGGMRAMTDAYYTAKAANPYVHVIQAYWDGVGDWRW